jgi:hypothetical membrane protein
MRTSMLSFFHRDSLSRANPIAHRYQIGTVRILTFGPRMLRNFVIGHFSRKQPPKGVGRTKLPEYAWSKWILKRTVTVNFDSQQSIGTQADFLKSKSSRPPKAQTHRAARHLVLICVRGFFAAHLVCREARYADAITARWGHANMRTEIRLLFGPIAAVIFFFGVLGLSLLMPGYSHVHQDVSTIGRIGSPERVPFSIVSNFYACSLLIFACGIFTLARLGRTSRLSAYLVAFMAFTQIGIAIFATPHPLHNMFGIASMFGFLAPIAMAVGRRKDRSARTLVAVSYILGFIVLGAIIANLSELYPQSLIWQSMKSVPGLVQRSLAGTWLIWLFVSGILMRRWARDSG